MRLLEWLKSKKFTIPNADHDMEQQKLSFTDCGNTKWSSNFGRQFGSLKKLNKVLLVNTAIGVLVIYPTDLKTHVHTKTCMRNFIIIPFIMSKKLEGIRIDLFLGSCFAANFYCFTNTMLVLLLQLYKKA